MWQPFLQCLWQCSDFLSWSTDLLVMIQETKPLSCWATLFFVLNFLLRNLNICFRLLSHRRGNLSFFYNYVLQFCWRLKHFWLVCVLDLQCSKLLMTVSVCYLCGQYLSTWVADTVMFCLGLACVCVCCCVALRRWMIDIQLRPYRTDDFIPKLYYEATRFSAHTYQWTVKARVNDNQDNPVHMMKRSISYQLILKSKPSSTLSVTYFTLTGPFGDTSLSPAICEFEFGPDALESPYNALPLTRSSECNRLLAAKTINFRLVLVQTQK